VTPWKSEPDREFQTVLAAAEMAGVKVYAVVPPKEDIVGPDGPEDWDGWACNRWPEVLGLTKEHWSICPTSMGIARAGEVVWCSDTCQGGDGFYTHWQALLHEVAHAVVAFHDRGRGPVGHEEDASLWEWNLAAAVWGPVSTQARTVRKWALESGLSRRVLRRRCKDFLVTVQVGAEVVEVAKRVWKGG
jgi:hypothetical protein